jgi:hemerythrin-like domain-containing protein
MPVSSTFGILEPGSIGPTFDEPFEMLEACHERLDRMLGLLGRLRGHLRAVGNDVQAQQAARDVMRYFDTAAPQHHRDEELHVFPVLLGLPDMVELVSRLQQDHMAMESRWVMVRSLLEEVESGMRRSFNEADDKVIDSFVDLYAGHIAAEEGTAFPLASSNIDPERLRAMSRDMAARRGSRP